MVNNKLQPHILVVDDQEDITWSLSQALSDKELNASVFTAANGKEALEQISNQTINILITDVMMLEVDDQDLFIEIKKKYPAVAVVVMTTLPTAAYKNEAVIGDKLFFIQKPFDINKLKQLVENIIVEQGPADPSHSGINLSDIIQLKCMGAATTALQINKTNQEGTIFFKDGELIHATCGQLEGEEALFKILSFGKGVITTSIFLESVDRTITRPGITLVKEHSLRVAAEKKKATEKEAARKKAEQEEAARIRAEEEAAARRKAAEEEAARKKAEEEEAARKKAEEEEAARRKAEEEAARKKAEEEAARKKAEEEAARKKAEEEAAARKKAEEEEAARRKAEEEEAARKKAEEEAAKREQRKVKIINTGLKDLITGLSSIEDYIAVGVLAPSGKLLIDDTPDQTLDLDKLGTIFNTLFREIRRTSKKVDFNGCRETIFTYAEDKTVIIRRSGTGENVYFHLMAIMASNRNLDLVNRVMDDFQSRTRKKLSEL